MSRAAALELEADPPKPLVDHVIELRLRLLVSLASAGAAALLAYPWSGEILGWLARPVGGLIFTAPADAFLIRLKVAFLAGLAASLPVILWQAWAFVSCALPPEGRALGARLLPVSYGLFLLGAGLALSWLAPAASRFLLSYGSADVRPLLSLAAYVDFVGRVGLSMALVFQTPIALFALSRLGVVSRRDCAERRRYVYFLAFVAAAFLSPGPDVVTQAALAVPFIALFELTLLAL